MNRIWRSIVGKLWITILLLVSFVLFVFTILMLEFLENYHKEKAEQSLNQTASTIASIVDKYNLEHLADEIIEEMLPEDTNALLVSPDHLVVSAFQTGINKVEIQESIVNSKDFNKIYESNKPIIKEMILPSQIEDDKMESYFVLSYPLKSEDALHGAIFIYQNPTALHKTSQKQRKLSFFQHLSRLF